MNPKIFLLLLLLFTTAGSLSAQTVIITDDPTYVTGQATAVLDVKSISKGFLMPRMLPPEAVPFDPRLPMPDLGRNCPLSIST